MYKDRQAIDYLNDILESIEDIREFTDGMNYDTFIKDRKTMKAVVRSLEVIGEAAKNVPIPLKEGHTEIPWQEIIGMRNKITHEYFGIDLDIVWQSAQEDLSPLESAIKKIIMDIESNNP
jgi:uncharacterized protein with HEPN domain